MESHQLTFEERAKGAIKAHKIPKKEQMRTASLARWKKAAATNSGMEPNILIFGSDIGSIKRKQNSFQ